MTLKLGRKPAVFDPRTLRFGAYATAQLPPPPASKDYGAKVKSWPMYDNDKYGDCTCAAAGHMIQNWTANAGTEVTPADASVLMFYEHFVGSPPPPDEGCNMLAVLKYWRSHGLGKDKILAFTILEAKNHLDVQNAIYLFGSIYIGVELPDFAVHGDMLTTPWAVPPGGPVGDAAPNPQNGHCIPAVGYDGDGLSVVTWGAVKTMSWDFYDAYAEEAYAVLSHDFIQANGQGVAGFDLATLQADLQKV
jgi:hypothetical protein